MTGNYGPLVRLWGVHPSQLPPSGATPSDIKPLLTSILNEALPFISTVPASHTDTSAPWKPKDVKTFPHSVSPVHLYERTVSAEELQAVIGEHQNHIGHLARGTKLRKEMWALRRSLHEDKPAAGTAAWDEWVRCFKDAHAEAEEQFTPSVTGTQLSQEWDCSGVEVQTTAADAGDGETTTWVDWTLRLESSTHRMPMPLRSRVFPVLQATAAARGRREFVVVQIAAEVERERNDVVVGAYTSVERVRAVEGEGLVEWVMGTVSDAKGVVPMWLQKLAVPGAIAKDVDMFLGWIAKEREREKNGDKGGKDGG